MNISILGLLGIIFVTLKLVGTIAWSWWLVLLPFYGLTALFIGLALASLGGAGICFGLAALFERRSANRAARSRR